MTRDASAKPIPLISPCGWMHEASHGAARQLSKSHRPPHPGDFAWSGGAPLHARDDGGAPHLPRLRALGLGGLIDAHSHWFPDNVNAKIWDYFDRHYWPVTYRGTDEARLEWMRRNGARRFTTLTYAHRPGMAEWLNAFTAEFAARVPEAIPCGTFFPETGAGEEVRRCIEEYGFRGFKLHLRVGDFDPAGAALREAFARIEAARLPVTIHCGSAPDSGRFTVPRVMRALLLRFPELRVVIAHMGAAEFETYLGLAESYPGVYLDTTMVFVSFLACGAFPPALLPRLAALAHKVLFGSDFPTIPYPFSHAVEGVMNLPLAPEALRAILAGNAAALYGVPVPG